MKRIGIIYIILTLTLFSCCSQKQISTGNSIENVEQQFREAGGSELDLSQYKLSHDDWLYAFSDKNEIVLIHTEYNNGVLSVGCYVRYNKKKRVVNWEGSKPISRNAIISYYDSKSKKNFPEYIGFYGENYDEDIYVYFLEECGFLLYNSFDDSIKIIMI